MKVHELNDAELFAWWSMQSHRNCPGVYRIMKGRQVDPQAVIGGSHGKEIPAGIAALRHVLAHPEILADDLNLFFVIGNLDAAKMFYATEDPEKRKLLRMTPGGRDMNRMPADPADLPTINACETRRVMALRGALMPENLQCILDLHSTDNPSHPSALGIVGDCSMLFGSMPLMQTIGHVVDVQRSMGTRTQTLSSILEPHRCAIEVEVGQTGSPLAQQTAVSAFEGWGGAIGVLKKEQMRYPRRYVAVASVMAPDTSYRVADSRFLAEFAPVNKGEVLLRNDKGDTITSPQTGCLVWGPEGEELTDVDVASEIWYILAVEHFGH